MLAEGAGFDDVLQHGATPRRAMLGRGPGCRRFSIKCRGGAGEIISPALFSFPLPTPPPRHRPRG